MGDPIKRIELKDGTKRYRFVIDVGRDPVTNKRIQETHTYDTLKEARSERARIKNEMDRGTYVRPTLALGVGSDAHQQSEVTAGVLARLVLGRRDGQLLEQPEAGVVGDRLALVVAGVVEVAAGDPLADGHRLDPAQRGGLSRREKHWEVGSHDTSR